MLRSNSASLDPVRRQLIDTLRLVCRSDEVSAVSQIIQTLSDIARDASAVQVAFPMSTSSDDQIWVSLIYKLIYRIQSYIVEADEISAERLVTQTIHLISDPETTSTTVVAGVQRAQWNYKTLPLIA